MSIFALRLAETFAALYLIYNNEPRVGGMQLFWKVGTAVYIQTKVGRERVPVPFRSLSIKTHFLEKKPK